MDLSLFDVFESSKSNQDEDDLLQNHNFSSNFITSSKSFQITNEDDVIDRNTSKKRAFDEVTADSNADQAALEEEPTKVSKKSGFIMILIFILPIFLSLACETKF